MKGFRDFVLRGNVLDLAVAVVIGAAFTAIVTSLVTNVITPLIGLLFTADDLKSTLKVTISNPAGGTATLAFGAFLASVINFVIVAAVVYFALVLPANWLLKRAFERGRTAPAAPVETPPTELDVLGQIRDLLAAQQARSGAGDDANRVLRAD